MMKDENKELKERIEKAMTKSRRNWKERYDELKAENDRLRKAIELFMDVTNDNTAYLYFKKALEGEQHV